MRHDIAPVRYFFVVEDFFDDDLVVDLLGVFFVAAFELFVLVVFAVELFEEVSLLVVLFSVFFDVDFAALVFFVVDFAAAFVFFSVSFFFEAVGFAVAAGAFLASSFGTAFLLAAALSVIFSILTRV
jgi:hypothetical protein